MPTPPLTRRHLPGGLLAWLCGLFPQPRAHAAPPRTVKPPPPVAYAYDVPIANRLTSVTTFTYDAVGRLTRIQDPPRGEIVSCKMFRLPDK
jgi:YD repeat-containing protein